MTASPDDRRDVLDPTTPLDELRAAIDRLATEVSTAWPSALESRDTGVLDRVVHAGRALRDAAQVLRSSGWSASPIRHPGSLRMMSTKDLPGAATLVVTTASGHRWVHPAHSDRGEAPQAADAPGLGLAVRRHENRWDGLDLEGAVPPHGLS